MGTPNHNYNIPNEGTTNWHLPLNENFKKIDSDIEIRDSEENKGGYEPKQGAKYEATDSGAVYYGNGDSWVLANRKVETLTSKNVRSKPVIVGEAFSGHHRYTGYNDLITAIEESPQQSEIIIQGNITVSETITPTGTYINLHGRGGSNRSDKDGMPSITASSEFSGSHLIDLSGLGSKWGSISSVNLFCDGNVRKGIGTGQSDNGKFEDILLRGPTEIGIEIEGGAFDNIIDRSIIKGKENNMSIGVYLYEGNEPKIYRSLIRDYSEAGLVIDNIGSVGARVEDTSFRGSGGKYGIYLKDNDRTGNNMFIRCQFEGHNQPDSCCIKAETDGGSTVDWWAAGCHFNGNNTKAIETQGKVGRYIIGPFNQFGCDVELAGTSASQGGSMLWSNVWFANLINNRNGGASLTVIEPSLDLFSMPAKVSTGKVSSLGDSGTRSYLGSFKQHPTASTGDTWYINGDSFVSEGFYGQMSGGPTQLH